MDEAVVFDADIEHVRVANEARDDPPPRPSLRGLRLDLAHIAEDNAPPIDAREHGEDLGGRCPNIDVGLGTARLGLREFGRGERRFGRNGDRGEEQEGNQPGAGSETRRMGAHGLTASNCRTSAGVGARWLRSGPAPRSGCSRAGHNEGNRAVVCASPPARELASRETAGVTGRGAATSIAMPDVWKAATEAMARNRDRGLAWRSFMHNVRYVFALLPVALAACSTPGARPEAMPAAEHEVEAKAHLAESREHAAEYDPAAEAVRPPPNPRVAAARGCITWADPACGVVYNPTARHKWSAQRHDKTATAHAEAAAALRSFEEGECKGFAPDVREACPLLGQVQRVDEIEGGVRVVSKDGINVAAWQAHIACHVAFAKARGGDGMAMCPLMVKGLTATPSGPAMDLTVDDKGSVSRLRELAAGHRE